MDCTSFLAFILSALEPLSLNLQILRKSKGLKQADMLVVGIKRTTWNNYETGLSEPSIETLRNIAIFFDISVDDLLNKDLSQDEELLRKIDSVKKTIKNNTENSVLNDEQLLYNTKLQNSKSKDQIILALKETVETQRELIANLKDTIATLQGQLKSIDKNQV